MLLNEFMEGGDLWGAIHTETQLDFITEHGAEKMNLLTKYRNGKHEMYFEGTIAELAVLVATEFGDKWRHLIAATAGIDITAGTVETTTDNTVTVESRNGNSTDTNKVSGFNSDELVVNDGSTRTTGDDLSGNKDRTLTRKKGGISEAFKNLDVLKKNDIIQTVINDVVGFATITLY